MAKLRAGFTAALLFLATTPAYAIMVQWDFTTTGALTATGSITLEAPTFGEVAFTVPVHYEITILGPWIGDATPRTFVSDAVELLYDPGAPADVLGLPGWRWQAFMLFAGPIPGLGMLSHQGPDDFIPTPDGQVALTPPAWLSGHVDFLVANESFDGVLYDTAPRFVSQFTVGTVPLAAVPELPTWFLIVTPLTLVTACGIHLIRKVKSTWPVPRS